VYQEFNEPEVLTKEAVLEWIGDAEGWFSADQLDRDLIIVERAGKASRRKILSRLVEEGLLERKGGRHGSYRQVDGEAHEIDWQAANPNAVLDLEFAFNIHHHVKLFPKSVIMIAGETNSGKTAFMYDFIIRNMHKEMPINLFNSETSGEQMRERFNNFGIEIPNPAPFKTYERYDNFADVIHPDKISVIDYLDLNSEVYMIGEEIERIRRKLKKGVAVIAIQKKSKQELGQGGVFSIKASALYLSMTTGGILTLVKGKSWLDPKDNPNGKSWKFKLVGGAKFVNITEILPDWPE